MAIQDLDEQVLVRAHQAGDEHAFGQIVRSQHRALYAHAYRKLGNHEAAEDAVQDTLLRAYRALPSFDGDLRLRAWLHRILTNVCYDESNRRRRQIGLIERLESQPIELEPDPVEEAVLHDTVRVMSDALAELPESYREALVLRYVDGLSFRDVADTVGISEENARARVHRGRLALHKVLARVTLMLGFLIPGLRRGAKAIDTGGDAVASTSATEHTVSLSTQLASHVYQAAPVINRVAAEGSSMVTAKSSLVATAVAAVAAVAAPVAVYTVHDVTKPQRPPAATAAPSPQTATSVSTSTSTTTPSSTTTAVPTSADATVALTTTTTTHVHRSTTTTSAPDVLNPTTDPTSSPSSGPVEHAAEVNSSKLAVAGKSPEFHVTGPVAIVRAEGSIDGSIDGTVHLYDNGQSDAVLTVEAQGKVVTLSWQATVLTRSTDSAGETWALRGVFKATDADGAAALGLPESGHVSIGTRLGGNGPWLSVSLRGVS